MTSDRRHCLCWHLLRCSVSYLVLVHLSTKASTEMSIFLSASSGQSPHSVPLSCQQNPSAPQYHFHSLPWAGKCDCPPGPLKATRSRTASVLTVMQLLRDWHCWVPTLPAAATNTEPLDLVPQSGGSSQALNQTPFDDTVFLLSWTKQWFDFIGRES